MFDSLFLPLARVGLVGLDVLVGLVFVFVGPAALVGPVGLVGPVDIVAELVEFADLAGPAALVGLISPVAPVHVLVELVVSIVLAVVYEVVVYLASC